MRIPLAAALVVLMTQAAAAQPAARPSGPLQQKIAPGLAQLTDEVLFGQVWPGAALSQRDRSLVVVSALIATNKPAQLREHLTRALANGVTPKEASGVLTHLAIYSGWPNAVSALEVYDSVFTAQKIDFDGLRSEGPDGPEATRLARALTAAPAASVAPSFAAMTRDTVLGDLWRRSDLSLRDRSLVTISALAAMGEADQMGPYLEQAVDAGLTRSQIGEALTHLAFYAGWPRAARAIAVADAALPGGPLAVSSSGPVTQGNFTGAAEVSQSFRYSSITPLGGGTVRFSPGARTRWHSHPTGQLLIVTAGEGWLQQDGDPVRRLRKGDVVWTTPDIRHWHGATRSSSLEHVAIALEHPSRAVQWFEPVSEAEFDGPG